MMMMMMIRMMVVVGGRWRFSHIAWLHAKRDGSFTSKSSLLQVEYGYLWWMVVECMTGTGSFASRA